MSKFLFALLVSVGVATAQDIPSVQDACDIWEQAYFRDFPERQAKNVVCASARNVREVCEIWKQYIDPIPDERLAYNSVCNRPPPTPTPIPEPTPLQETTRTPLSPDIGEQLQDWWNGNRNLRDLWGIARTPRLIIDEPLFTLRAPALVVIVASVVLTLASVVLVIPIVKSRSRSKMLENERDAPQDKPVALQDLLTPESEWVKLHCELKALKSELEAAHHKIGEYQNERNELQNKIDALQNTQDELEKARHRAKMLERKLEAARNKMKNLQSERDRLSSQLLLQNPEKKEKFHNTTDWDALRVYQESELQDHGNHKGYPKNWNDISWRLRKEHPWCSRCNFGKERGNPLQVHHIKGKPADCRAGNLQVLCEICHKREHNLSPFGTWPRDHHAR
jgi:hypothetical protein